MVRFNDSVGFLKATRDFDGFKAGNYYQVKRVKIRGPYYVDNGNGGRMFEFKIKSKLKDRSFYAVVGHRKENAESTE